ncbi:MAG: DEAD/DEAH box helicase, partial [Kiritimatiellaceae bacterium]|nr:DEAD/DEAH box helicase [Kiritimatiellaceae bacterium]
MLSFIEKIKSLFVKKQPSSGSITFKTASPAAPDRKPSGGVKSSAVKGPEQQESPRKRSAANTNLKPKGAPSAVSNATKPAVAKPKVVWNPESFQVEVKEGKTRFQDLGLPVEILHAIADLNFQYCTPIQAAILPLTLAGKDMAGKAQTGTGKTAAFLLGILTRFMKNKQEAPKPGTPRALILAPTRELAMQIRDDAEKLSTYTPFKTVAIYGGIDYDKQRRILEQPIDIIVATPGRLIDFCNQGVIDLREVEVLVIDEADRMLDMGFIPDVRKIVYKTPPKEKRQTLLFSATLDDEVMRLAAAWMVEPGKIEIEPDHHSTALIDQQVYLVTDDP